MYEVVVYFDNMIDDVKKFDSYDVAVTEANNLRWRYRHTNLYRVEVRECKSKILSHKRWYCYNFFKSCRL